MLSAFKKKAPADDATSPAPKVAEPEVLQTDFLGNPAVPISKAEKHSDSNPRYRNAFLPTATSARILFSLTVLVFALIIMHVALVIRENRRVDTTPQFFMQTEIGQLVPVTTFRAEPSVPLTEAFLDYLVSNLIALENGELTKADRVKALISDKAMKKILGPLIISGPKLRTERVNLSGRIHRIDTSAPERFVMNRRFKRAFGTAYGATVLVTGSGGGRSRETRWDFEIIFVPRTAENPWGMFANQLWEANMSDPYQTIPPELRRPEDLVAPTK